jgi:hypothetical protein
LWPIPDDDITIHYHGQKQVTALSADADIPLLDSSVIFLKARVELAYNCMSMPGLSPELRVLSRENLQDWKQDYNSAVGEMMLEDSSKRTERESVWNRVDQGSSGDSGDTTGYSVDDL